MLNSLFKLTTPTSAVVMKAIDTNEINAQDQKVTTWVHRYLRSCTKYELIRFVRFITGSSCFIPNAKLKVEFVNQPPEHLRLLSRTCFKILILPVQYSSFTWLNDNLDFHMRNSCNWDVLDNM